MSRKKQVIYFPVVFFHVGNQWTNNWALKPKLDSNTCECCIFIVYVLLTFTTLWRHSVPLRDLGSQAGGKVSYFPLTMTHAVCMPGVLSATTQRPSVWISLFFYIISHVKQQPFCSFVARATLEVIGLCSKANGRILSWCQNYTHVSDWIYDKVQHNTVKHCPTLNLMKLLSKEINIHIFQRVKINPGSTGLELCFCKKSPTGISRGKVLFRESKRLR